MKFNGLDCKCKHKNKQTEGEDGRFEKHEISFKTYVRVTFAQCNGGGNGKKFNGFNALLII